MPPARVVCGKLTEAIFPVSQRVAAGHGEWPGDRSDMENTSQTTTTVVLVGAVRAIDRLPGFVLLGVDGCEFEPATAWLLQLAANGSSPHTVRAYAMSLLRFVRFIWAVGCSWTGGD